MGEFQGLSRLVSTDLGPHVLPQQSTAKRFKNTRPDISLIAWIDQSFQHSIAHRLGAAIDIAGNDGDTTSHCF